MIGTTAALLGGGLMGGGSILGGLFGKSGANAQADAIDKATAAALAQQNQQQDLNRADLMPWMTAGAGAENKLAELLGIDTRPAAAQFQQNVVSGITSKLSGMKPADALKYAQTAGDPNVSASREQTLQWAAQGIPFTTVNGIAVKTGVAGADTRGGTMTASADPGQASDFGSLLKPFGAADFQTDPGYAFRLQQGQKALQQSAAAKGMQFSGSNLKALTDYNQNFASNEYTNAYNRFNTNQGNIFNRLSALSGGGQTAVGTVANEGTSTANNMANLIFGGATGAANARASGYSALGQGIGGAMNSLGQLLLLGGLGKKGGSNGNFGQYDPLSPNYGAGA